MPRNGNGVASLAEPPFVSGTVISSSAMNADLDDIADMLTGSIASDGQTPITAPIGFYAGTEDEPGQTWTVDDDTGRYRSGANAMADVCGGTTVAEYSTSGVNFPEGASVAGVPIAAVPIGGGMDWYTNTAPAGWLLCDGSAVSRTTYALLFDVIGTTYGSGDGATTFNLPNKIGRTGVGRDAGGSVLSGATNLGTALGAQSVAITIAQLPVQPDTNSSVNNADHTHSSDIPTVYNGPVGLQGGSTFTGVYLVASHALTASSGESATHIHTVDVAGAGEAHANVQPSLVQNFIIYAGV